MASFDLLSIGHSNHTAERFVALLQEANVGTVADVRSIPGSRRYPWFAKTNLSACLAGNGIEYLAMGDSLGGRPHDQASYRDGIADYEAIAMQPAFCDGLSRVAGLAAGSLVCLMCAEREPLDCHRCLLVARELSGRGLAVGHILQDGKIEPHGETEDRLLTLAGEACDLFAAGQQERLAAAYRRRARAVAYRQKLPPPRAVAERQ